MKNNHRIYLCLAKMSDNGMEQKYIQEAIKDRIAKTGICLPSGPWVTDDDVKYIVETILQQIS